MKKLLNLFAVLALLATTVLAAESVEAGPRRGRLLDLGDSKAEFFVEKDRKISIAFYDAAKKQQPAATQSITAIAEAPGGKKKLEFEKQGDLLISKEPLPQGENYNVVVQAKNSPDAKPKNFRIKLDQSTCKPCGNPEYACTCDEEAARVLTRAKASRRERLLGAVDSSPRRIPAVSGVTAPPPGSFLLV